MRESGGHVPTRPKRSRDSQCWGCCTVGTLPSRAPCGRSRGRLGLSSKLISCRFLPNIFLGADESALTCSTWAKRSRLSQCWRCAPLARRGHGPHVGALVTDLDSAANASSSNCRIRRDRGRCPVGPFPVQSRIESSPGTGGHITKPSWLHEHIRQPVTNLGRRLKFCFVLAYYISERERRSRTHEAETISGFSVLAVLHRWHVAVTSPMWALS